MAQTGGRQAESSRPAVAHCTAVPRSGSLRPADM